MIGGHQMVPFAVHCDCAGRTVCWSARCRWCSVVLTRHAPTRKDALARGREALKHDHRCGAVTTDAPVNVAEHKRRAQRRAEIDARRAQRRQAVYQASRAQSAGRP